MELFSSWVKGCLGQFLSATVVVQHRDSFVMPK